MTDRAYRRPPITEAVLELRFARSFEHEVVEKAASKLKRNYVYSDADEQTEFKINVRTRQAEVNPVSTGVRLSSSDRADVVVVRTKSFVVSRMAPYLGWDDYFTRAQRDWEIWRKDNRFVELTRVGLRYVNRLDIPVNEGELVEIKDFLHVWPQMPKFDWGPLSSFSLQGVRTLAGGNCAARVYSGEVLSPLVGHQGLALDLDIFAESSLPTRDDMLWNLLSEMRTYKNRLFEACITDRSRELFNR